MEKVTVSLRDRSYPIYIGADVLPAIGELCRPFGFSGRGVLITNSVVAPLYGRLVLSSLEAVGIALTLLEVPDGEEFKNLQVAG
ncbi:MAG: 3-dehydroquinate synthase, partial [candidate division NC10 bacterium]